MLPASAPRLTLAALALVACLPACSRDGTSPADHPTLAVGRYAVTFAHQGRPGVPAASYTGTLDVSRADADAVAGTFTLGGTTSALTFGAWEGTAYNARGRTPSGYSAIFLLVPARGGAVGCSGSLLVAPGDFLGATCSVTRQP